MIRLLTLIALVHLPITLLADSAPASATRPAHLQELFNELVASSRLWPSHVATLVGFEQPILRDGQQIGTVTIKPGTALKLASVKPEGVWVELSGLRKLLVLEETDLLQRIPGRRLEVEAIELLQAQRLRERAELPFVWPAPASEPAWDNVLTVADNVALAPRIRIPGYNVPGWFYPPPVYRIIYLPSPICYQPYPICPPIKPVQPIHPCPPRFPQNSGVQVALRFR